MFYEVETRIEKIMPNKQQPSADNKPYDNKGRCIYHPQIRLRKRSTLFKRNWITVNKQCPACFAELLSSSSYDDDIDKTSHTHRPQTRGIPPLSSVHDDKALQPHRDDDDEGCEDDDDEYDFECSSSTLTTAEETISSYSSASLSSSLSSLDGHNAAHYATTDEDNNTDVTHHRTKVVCGMPYVYYSYDVRGPSQEYCNANQGGGNRRRPQEQQCQEYERHGFYTGEIDALTSLPHGIGTWRCSITSPNDEGQGTILLEGSWFDGHLYTQSNSPQSNHQHSHHHSSATQSQQQRRLTPIMEHSSRAYDEEEESCIMYNNDDDECQGRRRRVGMNSFVLEHTNNDDDDDEPIYNNESSSVRRRTRRSIDPPSSLEDTHVVSERRNSGDGVGSSSNERGTREEISSLSLCSPCRI